MAWEVYALEEVEQWFRELDQKAFARIQNVIRRLKDVGPGLGQPLVAVVPHGDSIGRQQV